eukprot:m.192290 g.192290  ORF g.192290 m.192290 type:complete len:54 (-) comp32458_c10_seq1:167-328(-)
MFNTSFMNGILPKTLPHLNSVTTTDNNRKPKNNPKTKFNNPPKIIHTKNTQCF